MTALERGDIAVCVPGGGDAELRRRTLESLRAHTASGVPILTLGAGEDAFEATAPADVVIVQPGCLVAPAWLEGLCDAASGATVATASALTQHDLEGARALDEDGFDGSAAAVRARSLRLRPRLARERGPCRYIRRSALELVGTASGFSERCLEHGLSHVLADDVLVFDALAAPERSLRTEQPSAPLMRSLSGAHRALRKLSVVIDAGILHGPTTGTHVHVLELIAALARAGAVELTALVPDQPGEDAVARLNALPDVALRTYEQLSRAGGARADIVHRPFQVTNAGDLPFLRSLGDRLVLTQQDLIAFHNASYWPSATAWEAYRRLTRLALAAADRVVFFSAYARDEALAEELVAPARASVVHIGVDHPVMAPSQGRAAVPPAGAHELPPATPVILCLGTDFHHKNRLFALRVVEQLRLRHGWDGMLVFAGPTVAHGSSRAREAEWLAEHAGFRGTVIELGALSEAEKAWLLHRSALVLYPSVVEGFGLVPFEAAAHRVPCMWAPATALAELLPVQEAQIVPWNDATTADRALALMQDDRARERNLQAIGAAASGLTWDATAARLLEVYRTTADSPAATATSGAGAAYLLSEDAARLVGPGGELPSDVHRPLLALATRRRLAGPVFGALRLGYRASYALRRLRAHRRR